jgi:hypothetical protein
MVEPRTFSWLCDPQHSLEYPYSPGRRRSAEGASACQLVLAQLRASGAPGRGRGRRRQTKSRVWTRRSTNRQGPLERGPASGTREKSGRPAGRPRITSQRRPRLRRVGVLGSDCSRLKRSEVVRIAFGPSDRYSPFVRVGSADRNPAGGEIFDVGPRRDSRVEVSM